MPTAAFGPTANDDVTSTPSMSTRTESVAMPLPESSYSKRITGRRLLVGNSGTMMRPVGAIVSTMNVDDPLPGLPVRSLICPTTVFPFSGSAASGGSTHCADAGPTWHVEVRSTPFTSSLNVAASTPCTSPYSTRIGGVFVPYTNPDTGRTTRTLGPCVSTVNGVCAGAEALPARSRMRAARTCGPSATGPIRPIAPSGPGGSEMGVPSSVSWKLDRSSA
jgi:hypothetical protein